MTQCARCGNDRPVSDFYARANRQRPSAICRDCTRTRDLAQRTRSWLRFYGHLLKNAAKRHAVDPAVTPEYLVDLMIEQGGLCALTGRKLVRAPRSSTTASIDRIDNAKDYVPGNIRLTTWTVNRMRGELTDEQLFDWAQAILQHRDGSNERTA